MTVRRSSPIAWLLLCTLVPAAAVAGNEGKKMEQAAMKELRVELGPGEQLTVATSRTHDGAAPLMEEYFKGVRPLGGSYGFAPRAQLDVEEAKAGPFVPNNFVGLYTFPSEANARGFERDERWPPIKAKRPSIWSELRISKFVIPAPTVLRFRADRIYEVRYEWFAAAGAAPGDEIATPGKVIASFAHGEHEMLPKELDGPGRIRIIEWPDLATARAHAPASAGYRRLDSLYTRPVTG